MTGRISLYFENTIIITRLYNAPGQKAALIEHWKKIYGKGFGRASIVDEPDEKPERKEYRFKKRGIVENAKFHITGKK